MAEIVSMPKLGFDMAEGTLVHWVIEEGAEVAKGAVLAEIETDKATVEVESTAAGVLHKRLVAEGEVVPVGNPIAVIAAPGEDVKDLPAAAGAPAEAPAKVEVAPVDKVPVPAEASVEKAVTPVEEPKKETPVEPESGAVKASPLARRMAAESRIDLRSIKGSGPSGRIVKRDIEKVKAGGPAAKPEGLPAAQPAEAGEVGLPLPAWTPGAPIPEDERIPIEKLRAIIGKRMVESRQQIPHFYVTSAYNAAKLLELREQANQELPDGAKLSVNDFIIKAVALTLRQFPNLNASLTEKDIIRHGHVNIGVAVAVDAGLMTVTVKDADQKPLRVISQEVREMVARAREGKVRTDDIEGSTFSISNLGMYDVEHFVAIINPPEAAILAVGSALQVPVVEDGEVKAGWQMRATLSADHRITDGAEGARFMQALGGYLENPLRLML